MANNFRQAYLFNVLRRGAQPLTRPTAGRRALMPDAALPVGGALPVPPQGKPGAPTQLPNSAGLEINEEVTAADEVAHGRTTPLPAQHRDAPSLADQHVTESASAAAPPLQAHAHTNAATTPAQPFAATADSLSATVQARQPVDASSGPDYVVPAADVEQAVEVALTAHTLPAPVVVRSDEGRESERSSLLAGESVGDKQTGDAPAARQPLPQAGWREGESFTFDARRARRAATEDAVGEDEESAVTLLRRQRAPRVHAGVTPEQDLTPTIRLPRPAQRIEPEPPAMSAHRASSDDAAEVSSSSPQLLSRAQTLESLDGDAPARAELTTAAAVEPDRRGSHVPEQPRVGAPVVADWARELARELTANTSPRAEAPKLTINRLDVQVINQPPAPPIQFMPPPVESEPPATAADLDRHYLGRINFMI